MNCSCHVTPLWRTTLLASVLVVFAASRALAVPSVYHHVHLNSSDSKAASQWYADNFGGQAKKLGIFNTVGFGKTIFIFFQAKPGFPGSAGSVVDHVGFSCKNLEAKLKELGDAKVEIVSGIEQEGPIRFAYVKDPWGTLIELVEDPEIEGFHHVHLAATDPEATLRWYTSAFGGEIARYKGVVPGIRYGDMWVLVKKVAEAQAPTKGRAIDHLSWGFTDLDAAAVELKALGIKFNMEPTAFGTGKIAFITDPAGVLIELVGPAAKKK